MILVCLVMHSNVKQKMVNSSRGAINFRASKGKLNCETNVSSSLQETHS